MARRSAPAAGAGSARTATSGTCRTDHFAIAVRGPPRRALFRAGSRTRDAPDSDSDDSAQLEDLEANLQDDLETVAPLLRNSLRSSLRLSSGTSTVRAAPLPPRPLPLRPGERGVRVSPVPLRQGSSTALETIGSAAYTLHGGPSPGDVAHAVTGNISVWTGVVAAASAPLLLSIQRGSIGGVEETLAAVAQSSADLVQKLGSEAQRTVRHPGRAHGRGVVPHTRRPEQAGPRPHRQPRSRDRLLVRAYSFDGAGVMEALEAACGRGAACGLIADARDGQGLV